MNVQFIKNRAFIWIRRIFAYGLYSIITLILLGFLILQIPTTQEKLFDFYSRKFSKISGFTIVYTDFYLWWYDHLELNGLKIIDAENNTMIAIERLTVNFNAGSLLAGTNVNIDGVSLKGPSVNLVPIHEGDSIYNLNINVFIKKINEATAPKNKTASGGPTPKVNIGEIVLERAEFIYNNTLRDSITKGFDYNHFKLNILAGSIESFKVIGDTTQMNVVSMDALHAASGFKIENLSTFFLLSQKSMQLLGLRLKTEKSLVQDTIIFNYKSTDDLSDFTEKVNINAKIADTEIHPDDLRFFSNYTIPAPLKITGNFNGKISNFKFQKMNVAVGSTRLMGKLHMDGLPHIHETFIDFDVTDGFVNIQDLKFLFPDDIYSRLEPLDRFALQGKFTGFSTDFVADGSFNGTLGQLESDINVKINEQEIDESTFSGNLALKDFNLGEYFSDTSKFQKVTLRGNIKGKGLAIATTDFFLSGNVSSIGILGYNYSNIQTQARFASQLFSGTFSIDDANLKFTADGSIDIRPGNEIIKLKGKLDTAYLHNLKLTQEKIFLSSNFEINSTGLKIDDITGDAIFRNSFIQYQQQSLSLDSVSVMSRQSPSGRTLTVSSSLLDVVLEGDFYYSTLFQDFERLFKELQLNIKNDRESLNNYYAEKQKSPQEYAAKFNIMLHNINPIIALANVPVTISEGSKIEGKFTNGYTSILNAFTVIDSIFYKDKLFLSNEIEFNGSKIRDSANVLAMLTITSEEQQFNKNLSTNDLFAEGIWNGNHIDFNLDVDQTGTDNSVRLQSEIDFQEDSVKLKILPTTIRLLEKTWQVNQMNYILLNGKEISIHNLEFVRDKESILIEGDLSNESEKMATLTVQDLNLDILNTISSEKFSGTINGKVNIRDIYHNPFLQNDITVKELTVNNFLIGDITGTNTWNREQRIFNVNFYIDRLNKRTVSLQGVYDPSKKEPLDLKAKLEKTNIKIIEPFLRGIFSEIKGDLSGEYAIRGTFLLPQIQGEGRIEDGRIQIDYLKTIYNFSGLLGFTPREIIFKNFDLTDGLNNKASLDGYLIHRNFTKFRINLDANFQNFQILNTTAKDNSLFYGQAYGTGKLNMLGPLSNMKISATSRTEKNTRIYIPISGSESTERKDFVSFVSLNDTIDLNTIAKKKKADSELSGITMDLNLDITPDAYAEIIFDIKAGDIIRGYGNGDIKLQLDTKGEFNMFGLYEFERGNYNFTLYDIINKEFTINRGSRISWFGDPYTGVLNLSASYRQLATLGPVLSDQTEAVITSPQVRRKYPVEVLLTLDGPMLSPQINFDLAAKDLPDNVVVEGRADPVRLNFEFNAFKARLDEQELKRQVFSLIILRRFSPPDAFSTNGSLYNSVSELLSNQLSYWLTQVDQNLEIDLDLGTLDTEAFNTFQLRLSYSFFNGRLRVTRDGTFSNQYNRSDVSNMLGDWTVDYLLTQDGKFKVKMYNRSNLNQLNASLGNQAAITTGVSLLHTQNFNTWKDLIKNARDRRRKKLEEIENNEEAILEKEGSQ